ncbi:TetR/AcrR family transcriptional regulator [Streptomyces sp. NPDC050549]|uniref:TetR/AcrR family transcriptional regulator n=1 Tax=Streptomyces sp. NPDC050549 TaxID=3155406 RepID=UPI00343DC742
MPRQRRTGSYAVGRARQEAILDTATERFAQAGYHRTSMGQIAADVGLSEPGLRHHFPTKKHLLVAVADRRFKLLAAWAGEAPRPDDGTRPFRVMLSITERMVTQPGLIELFVLMSAEAAGPASRAHDLYATHYDQVVRAIAGEFRRTAEQGFLRVDIDYEAVARRYIAMSDGLQLQWVLSGGGLDLVGLMRGYLEHLALALQASPGPVDLAPAD